MTPEGRPVCAEGWVALYWPLTRLVPPRIQSKLAPRCGVFAAVPGIVS